MVWIVTTAADIRAWVSNHSPGNVCEAAPNLIGVIAQQLRIEKDRPAWGQDWGPWLEARAEDVAFQVFAQHDEETAPEKDDTDGM